MLGLVAIVELLAHPRADLLDHLGGVDRRIEPPPDREQQTELAEIGFDRRLHVGVLQLAGELRAVMRVRAMHLAERGGRGGMMLEACELLLPVRPKLGLHAALDEGPAHRRRLALQLGQLGDVFRRQRLRNGGEKLRHLHDRAFQAAQRRGKFGGVLGAVEVHAEEARARHPRRDAADVRADAGVAAGAGGEAVSFLVGHDTEISAFVGRRHRYRAAITRPAVVRSPYFALSNASSSPIIRSITPRPPCQNFGSRASRPNGASSSAWCLVPPAASISR